MFRFAKRFSREKRKGLRVQAMKVAYRRRVAREILDKLKREQPVDISDVSDFDDASDLLASIFGL